jgi:hypothetical protein
MAQNFVKRHDEGAFTANGIGIGISTAKAVSRLRAGLPRKKQDARGERQFHADNAARVLPGR